MENTSITEINAELEKLFEWLFRHNLVISSYFLYTNLSLLNDPSIDKKFRNNGFFNLLVEIFYKNWLKHTPDYKRGLKIARREKPKKEADQIVQDYYKGLLIDCLRFKDNISDSSPEYQILILNLRIDLIDFIKQVQQNKAAIEN